MTTPFPGARWWKFDLHTHTPASIDYGKGPNQAALGAVTPEDWLLGFMRAGIDCVAVTDHNTGEWIDRLKAALKQLETAPHPGYKPLYLFPGVEITASGGVHVLAILDRIKAATEIAQLLGAVRFIGTRGASDVAAECSVIQLIQEVHRAGGIPILAHVDGPSGAFKVLNGNTLAPLLAASELFAVEVCDSACARPELYRQKKLAWAEVLGSDAHHPTGQPGARYPGSHYTWIKMGAPSIEGLRLALLDGNEFSVRRSDKTPAGDPNQAPENWIESIEIRNARYMGRGQPEKLAFSPFMNALVGGRGTGKSTVVHFARAALLRIDEIEKMEDTSEPRRAFERFFQVHRSRDTEGGLTSNTEAILTYVHDGTRFQMIRRPDGTPTVNELAVDGTWQQASSQAVRERFPVRLFSQGQVLELTGRNSQALMDIIDQAVGASEWTARWTEAEGRFLTLRARARELRQKLAGRDRVRGQLDDVKRKLAKFEETQHAAILKEHQKRSRQLREIGNQRAEVDKFVADIAKLVQGASLSDPPDGLFQDADAVDATAASAAARLRQAVQAAGIELARVADALRAANQLFQTETVGAALGQAALVAEQKYQALVAQLQAEGVSDPSVFGALIQDRQRLETEERELTALDGRLHEVEQDAGESLRRLGELRRELGTRRRAFLTSALQDNRFVRMAVEPYGRDVQTAERSFREALGVTDDRFSVDILEEDADTDSSRGLIPALYSGLADGDSANAKIVERLDELKVRLEKACRGEPSSFGGHFENFLAREYQRRPEFLDRLLAWFPADGLRVEYSPGGDGQNFRSITQGSPGQRAAAMLAFFLAYGHEPIVLDQPEDDLDNHLIYDLVVQQLKESKKRRQIITVTHNPNIVVNGDAEMVHALDFRNGQCRVTTRGCLQENDVRDEVCRVMEGGREAFRRRYRRLADGDRDV